MAKKNKKQTWPKSIRKSTKKHPQSISRMKKHPSGLQRFLTSEDLAQAEEEQN